MQPVTTGLASSVRRPPPLTCLLPVKMQSVRVESERRRLRPAPAPTSLRPPLEPNSHRVRVWGASCACMPPPSPESLRSKVQALKMAGPVL